MSFIRNLEIPRNIRTVTIVAIALLVGPTATEVSS
jgi:hypothetical protein